ncbi:MAG: adenosylcobalamin-dependent ribonucleoside-diphosphate reductase [archaeon]
MSLTNKNENWVVRKRDGRIAPYEEKKVADAIFKSVLAVGGRERTRSDEEAKQVTAELEEKFFSKGALPTVEQIQDSVERVLIHNGHAKTAKAYILYRAQRNELRKLKISVYGRDFKTNLTPNALRTVAKRYAIPDEDGKPKETPNEIFERVATALSEVEYKYGKSQYEAEKLKSEFYRVLHNLEFLPGGRTLRNAGTDQPIVSNCIVLHIDDTMDGIFQTLKDAALLQQGGSGLGFPFHMLRPAGTPTKRSAGTASGPVSFLHVYNEAFGIIKQQGRHGANMAVMRVDHPDILDFIHCKEIEGKVRNFNISVGLTDEFMKAVADKSDKSWKCEFGGKRSFPRRITRDSWGMIKAIKEEPLTAAEIMNEIVNAAWNNGEPGVIFLDTVNKTNALPGLGRIEACNPCGEQFLHDGDVCNLGSINLEKFLTIEGGLDEKRLHETTKIATRMLDNVIDLTVFSSDRVNTMFRANRRIGLGLMGFADLLYKMRIRYNSPEGFEIAEKVSRIMKAASEETSRELAAEKGVFPNHDKSVFFKSGEKRRNSALTCIAPTGSISMVAEVSSGLEPYFALAYEKSNIMGGMSLRYVNKHLLEDLEKLGLASEEILDRIVKTGSVQGIDEIPEELRRVYITALEIPSDDHIKMQAAFQKHFDNAISKTVNFPNSATKEDVMAGYLLAWTLGCKGCTVYRNDSRKVQILNLVKKDEKGGSRDTLEMRAKVDPDAPAMAANGDGFENFVATKASLAKLDSCPGCRSPNVSYAEGCFTCRECGYSACSM